MHVEQKTVNGCRRLTLRIMGWPTGPWASIRRFRGSDRYYGHGRWRPHIHTEKARTVWADRLRASFVNILTTPDLNGPLKVVATFFIPGPKGSKSGHPAKWTAIHHVPLQTLVETLIYATENRPPWDKERAEVAEFTARKVWAFRGPVKDDHGGGLLLVVDEIEPQASKRGRAKELLPRKATRPHRANDKAQARAVRAGRQR